MRVDTTHDPAFMVDDVLEYDVHLCWILLYSVGRDPDIDLSGALRTPTAVHAETIGCGLILMGGWIGALAYIFVEIGSGPRLGPAFPQLLRPSKKIEQMEAAVHDNPSPGKYEELGMALLDDKQYGRARECYDKAITSRTNHTDVFYRRALCAFGVERSHERSAGP